MSCERKLRVDQDEHEAKHQQENQCEAALSPLLVFELSTPFDSIGIFVEFDPLSHISLSFRKQGGQVAVAVVELYGQMPLIALVGNCAFPSLQLDSGDL